MARLTGYDADGKLIVCEEEWLLNAKGFITKDEMYKIMRHLAEKLSEYEDMEEQGKLPKLPCAVGDMVYTACSWGIESGVVGSIEIISDKIFVNNVQGQMIGEARNIFLTRPKAEQALKEMKGKK